MSREMDDLESDLLRAWGIENKDLVRPVALSTQEGLSLPLNERHDGALITGTKDASLPLDETRRKLLTFGLRMPLVAATYAVLSNPATGSLLGIGTLGGVGYQIYEEHEELEQSRYGVRRRFVERIEETTYLETDASNDIDLNAGEAAIRDSIDFYRLRLVQDLAMVQPALRAAAESTNDPQGRAVANWRLMVDSSFLGEGKEACVRLKKVNFTGLGYELKLKLLDGATSTALNLMSSQEFVNLASSEYEHISRAWNILGADISSAKSISSLYKAGRIGSLAAAMQHTNILAVRKAAKSGVQANVEDAQSIWFESLWELNHRLHKKPFATTTAFNFLQSLSRPTFHAAATKNFKQMHLLLDYYFGRKSRPSDPESVSLARETVEREWGGNSPWMLLLDLSTQGRSWSQRRLGDILASGKLRLGSPQLKKAFLQVGEELGFPRAQLLLQLQTSLAETQVPETTLVRYYLDLLSQSRRA